MRRFRGNYLLLSYITLRQAIGYLAILLPILCVFFGYTFADLPLQRSISYYYHTNVRDLFVGILIGVSFFLLTYIGYESIDKIVTSISGVSSLGVALFPCLRCECLYEKTGLFQLYGNISNKLHLTFAITFFLTLAINSLFLFTKTDRQKHKTKRKKIRNIIYIVCGLIIVISLIFLLIIKITVPAEIIASRKTIFWFEFVMLFAFGISWLVKGEVILRDAEHHSKRRKNYSAIELKSIITGKRYQKKRT